MNKLDNSNKQIVTMTMTMPLSLKQQLEWSAKKNCRTIAKEIVFRLLTSFSCCEESGEGLLNFLERLMERKKSVKNKEKS